jgi:hypothetical protein
MRKRNKDSSGELWPYEVHKREDGRLKIYTGRATWDDLSLSEKWESLWNMLAGDERGTLPRGGEKQATALLEILLRENAGRPIPVEGSKFLRELIAPNRSTAAAPCRFDVTLVMKHTGNATAQKKRFREECKTISQIQDIIVRDGVSRTEAIEKSGLFPEDKWRSVHRTAAKAMDLETLSQMSRKRRGRKRHQP